MKTTNMDLPIGYSTNTSRVLVDANRDPILTVEQRDDMFANKQIIQQSISGVLAAAHLLKVDPVKIAGLTSDGTFLAALIQVSTGAIPTVNSMLKTLTDAFPGKRLDDLSVDDFKQALAKVPT